MGRCERYIGRMIWFRCSRNVEFGFVMLQLIKNTMSDLIVTDYLTSCYLRVSPMISFDIHWLIVWHLCNGHLKSHVIWVCHWNLLFYHLTICCYILSYYDAYVLVSREVSCPVHSDKLTRGDTGKWVIVKNVPCKLTDWVNQPVDMQHLGPWFQRQNK